MLGAGDIGMCGSPEVAQTARLVAGLEGEVLLAGDIGYLDEDGYLASHEQVGRDHFVVIEHNCAIAAVANRYGQACTSEIDFIRAVLPEADVTRISHMVNGDRRCAYDIVRRR